MDVAEEVLVGLLSSIDCGDSIIELWDSTPAGSSRAGLRSRPSDVGRLLGAVKGLCSLAAPLSPVLCAEPPDGRA